MVAVVAEEQEQSVTVGGPHFIAAAAGQICGLLPDFFTGSGVNSENHSYIGIVVCQTPFGMLLLKQLGFQ